MLLLKRMRRDIRKGDLEAFESKVDELKLELAWLRPKMVKVQCWFGCSEIISVPEYIFEHFTELRHKCGSLTSLKYQVQSKSEPIQETKPQPSQPAKEWPLMLSWNCPRCHQAVNVSRWYMESHPEYTAGYFMAAQTLVRAERVDDAKKMLNDGIVSARRTGNLHAQSEMEAMLAELG